VIIVCLALCGAAQAAAEPASAQPSPGVAWQAYTTGMAAASAQKRSALIKFDADWCSWCHKLDDEVLTQPQIVAQLKSFVCIAVDVDKQTDVAMAYGVTSLPRVLVINTHDEIVGDWLGFRPADEFLKLLRDIEPYLNMETGTTKRPTVLPSASTPAPRLGPNSVALPSDPNGMLTFLGHQHPAIRQKMIDVFVRAGRPMTPLLLQALQNDYLGVRIAACKALRAIAGRDIDFDPWAPAPDRAKAAQAVAAQFQPLTPPPPAAGTLHPGRTSMP
jgi:thiol-disulfide isomerase/thioredoxin